MKISELQEVLEKFKQEYGDLEVVNESFSEDHSIWHFSKDDFYIITDWDGKAKLLNIFT